MSITSYAELQTAVGSWLNRSDLTSVIPDFIMLAEKSLGRDARLRKLKSATFTVDADDETVPSDFHSLQSWYHDDGTNFGPIEIVPADELSVKRAMYDLTGVPQWAAIIDGKFRFAPAPDGSYTTKITYWRTIGSVSAGTSWLFTESPDLYLFASLAQAEPYLKNDPRIQTWKALVEQEIEAAHLETWNYHAGGRMRVQSRPIG